MKHAPDCTYDPMGTSPISDFCSCGVARVRGPNRDGVVVSPSRGPAVRVRSAMFYPLDPTPETIFVRDMAHALSNVVRWGGHCGPYTVAQHAVVVSILAEFLAREAGIGECGAVQAARVGLHHEAAEAFGIGDVARPYYVAVPALREVHDRILEAALASLGLPPAIPEVVQRADDDLCRTEAVHFFGAVEVASWNWKKGVNRPTFAPVRIWTHAQAEREFLERHAALGLPLH